MSFGLLCYTKGYQNIAKNNSFKDTCNLLGETALHSMVLGGVSKRSQDDMLRFEVVKRILIEGGVREGTRDIFNVEYVGLQQAEVAKRLIPAGSNSYVV